MSWTGRLLGLWVAGKTVSSTTPLVMRLLIGMVVMTLLAVFSAIVMAFLLAGLSWLSYAQLVAHGVSSGIAIGLISMMFFILLLMVALLLQHYWRKASIVSRKIMLVQSPISERIHTITEAFMDGLNAK